jgi:hypothetical protein
MAATVGCQKTEFLRLKSAHTAFAYKKLSFCVIARENGVFTGTSAGEEKRFQLTYSIRCILHLWPSSTAQEAALLAEHSKY